MSDVINENLKKTATWKRIIFILVFAVIASLVRLVLWLVVFLQVASALLTASPNYNLTQFGRQLSEYLYQIWLFLTYNTDSPPFPFSDWNLSDPDQPDHGVVIDGSPDNPK
ncbi:MAG: DUF4389 domain-containing protein [Methylococcales bacterium]|nr:DUF4389 domain-containing protein [Methylococcales bacterium]